MSATIAQVQPTGTSGEHPLLSWVVRRRFVFFALLALLYLAAFNGQWRIGRDSSLYRGVARSLAEGKGFTFNGKRERHAYPGLPLMLAAVDRVFGHNVMRPVPAIVLMLAAAAATLVIVYRLVCIHFPQWMAVMVTCGLAINWRFLQQSHELMTDMPFALGVCAALLGFERLRLGRGRGAVAWGMLLSAGGLALAAAMRPTFWFLAAAWGIACTWGLFRGPARLRHALGLCLLLLPAVAFIVADPRSRSARLLAGRYEEDAARAVSEFGPGTWLPRLIDLLDAHFTEILFGTTLAPGLNALLSLAFVASGFWLIRRVPLWGLLVAITIVSTYLLGSSVPRYYLMILPLVLLGWTLLMDALLQRIAGRPKAQALSLLVIILGFGCITLANLGKNVGFIAEQHGITLEGRKPFLQVYRDGRMLPVVNMSRIIAQRASADARILGPEPRIMSYLSGRQVFALADELRDAQLKSVSRALRQRQNADRDLIRRLAYLLRGRLRFTHAVFPAKAYEAHLDPLARRLIALRIIRTRWGRKLGKTDGWWLGKVQISADAGRGPEFRPPRGLRGRELKELEKKVKKEQRLERQLRRQRKLERKAAPATRPAFLPHASVEVCSRSVSQVAACAALSCHPPRRWIIATTAAAAAESIDRSSAATSMAVERALWTRTSASNRASRCDAVSCIFRTACATASPPREACSAASTPLRSISCSASLRWANALI